MLQLLYDPLQLIPLGGMHILALLHHVPGQLGYVCGGLEVLAELDALPLPFLRIAEDKRGSVPEVMLHFGTQHSDPQTLKCHFQRLHQGIRYGCMWTERGASAPPMK